MSVRSSTRMSVHRSVYSPIRLYVRPFVCSFVRLSTRIFGQSVRSWLSSPFKVPGNFLVERLLRYLFHSFVFDSIFKSWQLFKHNLLLWHKFRRAGDWGAELTKIDGLNLMAFDLFMTISQQTLRVAPDFLFMNLNKYSVDFVYDRCNYMLLILSNVSNIRGNSVGLASAY